jgi:replicative DNA helicase
MPPAPEANVPPQDLDAEESVLGAMLLNEQAVITVSEVIVDPGDFYREAHGTIYRAILALLNRSEPIDAVTVSDELERMGKLEDVGGRGFVFGLSSAVTVAANAKAHAQIVRDLALLRRVAAAGLEIAELGYGRQGDVRDILDRAESAIFDIAQERTAGQVAPIGDLLSDEVERMANAAEHRGLIGHPSGLKGLDRITSGFQNSNLIILAARPAMGKTSLALGIARHLGVVAKVPVVIFSLEMSSGEIAQRFISSEARVDSMRMRRGDLRDDDWNRVQDACNRLTAAPIYVDDTASINLMEIRSKARRLKLKEPGLGLVMVDYLQLMSGESAAENRVQEISQISRSLKALARDLDVPVIALSQLSRAVEQRTDKRPLLSDLRESGCLTGDSLVYLPDTGERVRIDAMRDRVGERVLALDPDTWRLEPRVVVNAFPTGEKLVHRMTLASGRTIRATANHRFRLPGGWRRLDEIAVGDRLAVPAEPPAAADAAGGTAVLAVTTVALDAVAAIEPDGAEPVWDLTVEGLHNFVADDIVVHNSIEQDADLVMFIYRDDYYNKETSEKPGTAELIVAKHRNGAIGSVDLAFIPHFTTFADLARGEA